MSATAGRVRELLADVLPRIAALGEEAKAEIGRVREEASARMARYEEAVGELARIGAEISALEAEKEEMPVRHSRAVLDDDVDEELRLKQRYQEVRLRLEGLKERRPSLEEETVGLLPNARGHRHDAAIERMAAVAGAAFEERTALDELRGRLTEALDAAVGPVADAHDQAKGTVESLSSTVAWEESPVGRGAARS